MIADPYRTEPERPMSEVARDKLLIATASLAAVSTAALVGKVPPNIQKSLGELIGRLSTLLTDARREMGGK